MNNQIYVLGNSIFAVGSISGAMLVALGTGCPSLIWGFQDAKIPTHDNNPLLTPMQYIGSMHPKVSDILDGIEDLKIKNLDFDNFQSRTINFIKIDNVHDPMLISIIFPTAIFMTTYDRNLIAIPLAIASIES